MAEEPQVRVSDDERNEIIDRLQDATTDGRITMEEFQSRSRTVFEARYRGDLDATVADLPVPVAASAAPATPRRRWLVSIMGASERSGAWDPGTKSVVVTLMGGQTLDLTRVDADEVSISGVTLMGGTEIIVPRGAIVDDGGFMLFGGISNDSSPDGPSTMRVRVRVFGGMGACEVRNLSEKEERKRAH